MNPARINGDVGRCAAGSPNAARHDAAAGGVDRQGAVRTDLTASGRGIRGRLGLRTCGAATSHHVDVATETRRGVPESVARSGNGRDPQLTGRVAAHGLVHSARIAETSRSSKPSPGNSAVRRPYLKRCAASFFGCARGMPRLAVHVMGPLAPRPPSRTPLAPSLVRPGRRAEICLARCDGHCYVARGRAGDEEVVPVEAVSTWVLPSGVMVGR
jgi:hypothetical protein